jgi:hypothetical protein
MWQSAAIRRQKLMRMLDYHVDRQLEEMNGSAQMG